MSETLNSTSLRKCKDLYATDPVAFAYDVLRVEWLSNQQEDLLRELGEFSYCNMYQRSVEELTAALTSHRLETSVQQQNKVKLLTRDIEGIQLTPEQASKYVRKNGFAVSSGRDTGKSCVLSIIAFWFLSCFEKPQGYIMAPTGQQAKAVLMAEIAHWANRKIEDPDTNESEYAFLYRDQFDILAESIRFKAAPMERFIEVKKLDDKSSPADQIGSFSGFHSPEQLFFIDEAVKFKAHIMQTINSTNAGPMNFAISIFNPVVPESYAVQSVFGDKTEGWIGKVWSCEKSDKPGMQEHIKARIEEYGGTDNDLYRVNVQGLPAMNSDDAMFPIYTIAEARGREPIYPDSPFYRIGYDVAGEGNDDAFCVVSKGYDVIEMHSMQGKDDWYQRDFIWHLSKKYQPKEIILDYTGIGRGVYNLLRESRCPNVKKFVSAKKPTREVERFKNQRDQAYFRLRDLFKDGKISFNLEEGDKHFGRLRNELIATGFKYIENGQTKVHPKPMIKEKLGGKSPDAADALAMCFSGSDYEAEASKGKSDFKDSKWGRALEQGRRNSYSMTGGLGWKSV